jgi:hypothetical protein
LARRLKREGAHEREQRRDAEARDYAVEGDHRGTGIVSYVARRDLVGDEDAAPVQARSVGKDERQAANRQGG